MTQRREIRFGNLEEVKADLASLLVRPYAPKGAWDLSQITNHLADWMTFPMDGFPKMRFFVKLLVGTMRVTQGKSLLKKFVQTQRMSTGQPTIPQTVHLASSDAVSSVARLTAAIDRLSAHRGPIFPSPLFGELDYDTVVSLQLAHSAHHLSFLVPPMAENESETQGLQNTATLSSDGIHRGDWVKTAIVSFLACVCYWASGSHSRATEPSVESSRYGVMPDNGESVQQFTLRNRKGMEAKVVEYGATLVELTAPDQHGVFANMILSPPSLEALTKGFPAASVIGRYANRIRGASFVLDGQTIQLSKNAGQNHIHGGHKHFGKRLWKGATNVQSKDASVELKYTSEDGEEGFPGTLNVSVTYSLNDAGELGIQYRATVDKPTIVNLTNHAYFNLSGTLSNVLDHVLQIEADQFTLVDKSLIPSGELAAVDGTPLDFRTPRLIGERISELYEAANGYDHNYVLRGDHGSLRLAARVYDPKSGRILECLTTEPGLQLYSSNGFNNNPFPKHGAFCLETQHYPDSPNRPEFPTTVMRPDKPWESNTIFRFSVKPSDPAP